MPGRRRRSGEVEPRRVEAPADVGARQLQFVRHCCARGEHEVASDAAAVGLQGHQATGRQRDRAADARALEHQRRVEAAAVEPQAAIVGGIAQVEAALDARAHHLQPAAAHGQAASHHPGQQRGADGVFG